MDARLTARDAAELGRCFREHAAALSGYACLMTRGDHALADDLVQETFQAAALKWSSLRDLGPGELRGWLRATIHNIAVSMFRRNAMIARKQSEVAESCRIPDADTYRDAMNIIVLDRCWQVISQLPARQHLIAVMRWRGDMKPKEIADALGLAPGTVSAQLHAIRQKLLSELNDSWG